jgi:two-component system, sensor histidine kinase
MVAVPDHDPEPVAALRGRLAEAEDLLRAIRHGEIDALVVQARGGSRVYTLHNTDEPYRNLVEQMQEGAVVLTGSGDILYCNERFAALVGKRLDSVVGSRFERFVAPPDRDGFAALLKGAGGRLRCTFIGADAGSLDVSLSLTTAASTTGNRFNLIVTDLRELLEANSHRDRAVRDNRSKDEFVAMLAHELRNPLSAIHNAVAVLESTHAEGEAASRAHEVIARQVSHISRLIDDLLDVERVVSGKIRLNRTRLDVAGAVRRAVAIFTGDERLDRHVTVTTEPAWVDGDAVRLDQVLTNILANAVKYTPAGAEIRVVVRGDGTDVVITIEDTGFGISPALLPSIFDMYMQADRTLDRARGGLGIGLTLVRRLVQLHGGSIVAASDGEGHGSTFSVRLPQVPSAACSPDPSPPPERFARSRRVLLIEDSADAREMLRMMLEFAGHVVYEAADGMRGLELLHTARPDVAIIDIGLPVIDGYEVARRIRAEPLGRRMLLLALTGYGSPGESAHSSAHGFDHHLVKPVDPDHLSRLISESTEVS